MKIGKNRIAVLIGIDGKIKKEIEKALGVKINIDSKTGDCEVLPIIDDPNYIPLNVYTKTHKTSKGTNYWKKRRNEKSY